MRKHVCLLVLFVVCSASVQSQEFPTPNESKVQTLDSTLETLYSVISGEIGEARDWELFRFLFLPDAKLIPAGKSEDGTFQARYMTVEDYINTAGSYLVENGFFEKEIHRTEQSFGTITQVFSTYESFRSEKDTEPFMRGINSIQLLNDGERWWVVNIYWTQETPLNQIPKEYLPKNK